MQEAEYILKEDGFTYGKISGRIITFKANVPVKCVKGDLAHLGKEACLVQKLVTDLTDIIPDRRLSKIAKKRR